MSYLCKTNRKRPITFFEKMTIRSW